MSEPGHCPPRVAKVSRWMAHLCIAALIVLPLMNALGFYDHRAELITHYGGEFAITAMGRNLIILFAISLIFWLPLFWGILQLRRLFICYAEEQIFSRAAARYLSRFALAWFLSVFASILGRIARFVAIDMQGMTGIPKGMLTIDGGDFGALFSSIIFMIVAWVLAEAAVVAEDHREFV